MIDRDLFRKVTDSLKIMGSADNLHPIFDRVVARAEKEVRLRQRARVMWLYGLSGSGKSTLAIALERRLYEEGFTTHLLDGDNVRTGLNANLGFSEADRTENIRRVAQVAKLFVHAGVVTICSFITPLHAQRESARAIIGSDDLLEVYVKASFETCAQRDVKGIYAKAKTGALTQLPGRDFAWDEPTRPDLVIETERESVDDSFGRLHDFILPRIRFTT